MGCFDYTDQIIGHSNRVRCAKENELSIIKNDIKKLRKPSALTEDLVVTTDVGGVEEGTVFTKGTTYESILKAILAPAVPVIKGTLYFGCFDEIPASINVEDGWVEQEIPSGMTKDGIIYVYTTEGKQFECFAFPKECGELKHIYENNLTMFDLIDSFDKVIVIHNSTEYYLYYGIDKVIEEDCKYEFYWE